jgi:hypothetical protein
MRYCKLKITTNASCRLSGTGLIFLLVFYSIVNIQAAQTSNPRLSPSGMKLINAKIAAYPVFDFKAVDEAAKKRYPLIKEGEETTLRSRNQSVKGKFYGINPKYIKIGTKRVARFDLTREQLSKFIPELNAEMRRKYKKVEKNKYKTKKRLFEKDLIEPLLKQYPLIPRKTFSTVFRKLKDRKLAEKYIDDLLDFYDKSLPIPDNISKKQFARKIFYDFVEQNKDITLDGAYVITVAEKKRKEEIARKRQEAKEKKLEERIAYPTASTPIFTPDGGAYDLNKTITITSPNPYAVIHYTLNNETPTEESPIYKKPLLVKINQPLKAIALHPEYNDSDIACMDSWTESGLYASYFNRSTFTGKTVVKLEKNIFLSWPKDELPEGINDDYYSALWTGQLIPPTTGEYTFYLQGDDGVRMWLNGKVFIDGWVEQARTEYKETISLVAGKRYDIKLALAEMRGASLIMLEWTPPNSSRQPVPSNCLTPAGQETDKLKKWNKLSGNRYINRKKMINPGSYKKSVLFRFYAEMSNKQKVLQQLKQNPEK